MEFNATFIVSAISFIVFSIIMNAIFYKPLQKVVDNRKNFIDEHHKEAALAHEKSDSLLKDKEQKLEEAKQGAKKTIMDKSESAKKQKAIIAREAQKVAIATIEVAKEDLQKSNDMAQEVLSEDVVELAQSISSKILKEDISIVDTDKDLISKIMQG